MTPRATITGLVLVSVLQIGVLGFEYLGAVYPLWSDVSVKLKTVPVDPRSLFRGNYAQLRYEISRLPMALYQGTFLFAVGIGPFQEAYAHLQELAAQGVGNMLCGALGALPGQPSVAGKRAGLCNAGEG